MIPPIAWAIAAVFAGGAWLFTLYFAASHFAAGKWGVLAGIAVIAVVGARLLRGDKPGSK